MKRPRRSASFTSFGTSFGTSPGASRGSARRTGRITPRCAVRTALGAVLGVLLTGSILPAQSRTPEDLATGKLLVTPRDASDPNFAKSVVLLVEYGEDGAVGLMINRQTTVPVSRALPELKGASTHSEPVYVGGPVGENSVLALLQSRTKPPDAEPVFGNLYLVPTKPGLESALAAGGGPSGLHIYVGYCGWAPGQLENEVRRGSWYIFDGRADAVFDFKPATLWARMIARTEMRIAGLLPVSR